MERIPKISDKRLEELCARIQPVVRFVGVTYGGRTQLKMYGGGDRYYIKPDHPRNVAYMWDPKPTQVANGLVKLLDIVTYHTFSYHGFFKPSVAEVIAQIPGDCIDKVVAFEIIQSPETVADLNAHGRELDEGYHVATTRLYKPKK